MLLSIQQRDILHMLYCLGSLRERQIHALLQGKYRGTGLDVSERAVHTMLKQLRHLVSELRVEDDILSLAGRKTTFRHLEAVNVMIELTDGAPLQYRLESEAPMLLRFSWGDERIRLFTVATLSDPLSAVAETYTCGAMEHVVWISDSGTMLKDLRLPTKHFFAARQDDGTHRFYGVEES